MRDAVRISETSIYLLQRDYTALYRRRLSSWWSSPWDLLPSSSDRGRSALLSYNMWVGEIGDGNCSWTGWESTTKVLRTDSACPDVCLKTKGHKSNGTATWFITIIYTTPNNQGLITIITSSCRRIHLIDRKPCSYFACPVCSVWTLVTTLAAFQLKINPLNFVLKAHSSSIPPQN
jgi:hypothetical protein